MAVNRRSRPPMLDRAVSAEDTLSEADAELNPETRDSIAILDDRPTDRRSRRASPRRWLGVVEHIPVVPLLLVLWTYRRGGSSVVRAHDTLDAIFALWHPLTIADLFSLPGQYVNGPLSDQIARDSVGSEFHLGTLIGVGLPTFAALLLTELIVRCVAFSAMRLLLGRTGLAGRPVLLYGLATIFALQPFYLPAFGAVAGLPLLFYGVLKAVDDQRIAHHVLLLFAGFPIISGFPYTAAYIAVLAAVAVVMIPWNRVGAFLVARLTTVLLLAAIVVDWRLFWHSAFGPVSHRSDMFAPGGSMHRWWWGSWLWTDLAGDATTEIQHVWIGRSALVGAVIAVAAAAALLRPSVLSVAERRLAIHATLLTVGVLVFARWWPRFEGQVVKSILADWSRFQLERVRFVEAVTVYLLFGLACLALARLIDGPDVTRVKRLLSGVVVGVIIAVQGQHLVVNNYPFTTPNGLSISEYFGEDAMATVAAEVAKTPLARTISVGFHPAAAIYHGIPTADGYWSIYPLTYKQRFRELIAPALEDNDRDASYYDGWGSRAYVFQPDQGRPGCCYAPAGDTIELVIDTNAVESLGITHVISASVISNASALGLSEVLVVDGETPLAPIHLYRTSHQAES